MKLARGQRCQICTHPQRKQIELCVIETDNKKATALKFGLNLHSLAHHFIHHVPKAIERAAVARKIKLGDNMLDEIEKLHETTLQILTEARKGQDHRSALGAIKEARGNIELTAKLLGKLKPDTPETVSFTFEHLQVLYLGLKEQGAIT